MLPDRSVVWPPPDTLPTYSAVREWAAWWTGDPNSLASFYAGPAGAPADVKTRRPWMFWTRRGSRPNDSGSVTKLHVPVAGDLATFSADLLFADDPEILIPQESDGPNPTGDRLEKIIDEGSFYSLLVEAAETAAALGGVYLRPVWDTTLSDYPFSTVIHPDNAVPVFRWGRLSEVTFWEVVPSAETTGAKKGDVVRHLEHHSVIDGVATIEHGLFLGTDDRLGMRIPLAAHPRTAVFEETDGTIRISGLGRLDVEYVPNMRPNRKNRKSPEGRSDFDSLEGLFDSLDEVWTSWMRDIRLGQSRIIVPADFLEKSGRGSGSSFDVDSEVFTPLEIDPNIQEKAGINVVQFTLRTREHLETALALLERIVDSAGYSPQSFGLRIEGRAESGTALKLRESKTFRTQSKKRRYWEKALERHLETVLAVDRFVFGSSTAPVRPSVVWPDQTAPGLAEMATTLDALKRAVAVSTETRVRMVHPDWSPADVAAEVARIVAEEGLEIEPPERVGGIDVPPPPWAMSDDEPTIEQEPTPEEPT